MDSKEERQLLEKGTTDWFRGIAVVMVVLSHYAEWWTWFVPTEGTAETFRFALARLGPYGVDIFLLFSGYAMVKSLGQNRMSWNFIWKRIKNVYIPYLLVVGIIEVISGGFTSVPDFVNFIIGHDYWYMAVLFAFYIAFILIWGILRNKTARVVLISLFAYFFSRFLYKEGMNDFWYISNIAFVFGIIAAEYETVFKKISKKAGWIFITLMFMGMLFVVRFGLENIVGVELDEIQIRNEIIAAVIWTLFILFLGAKWNIKEKVGAFLGKQSLYIYLTHTFIFMSCVNAMEAEFGIRFAVSAILTIFVSVICNLIIGKILNKNYNSGKKKDGLSKGIVL